MTKEEIKEILEAHRRWLYNEPDGKRADLCGADLRGANLCGADLREADLRGADLRGADLRRANLREADLRGADLRRANLREADLCRANLCRANLREADLCRANLCRADLRGADLREVDLRGANLREADLCGANLREADLREVDLRGANLREADLCGADLRRANLCGAENVPFIPMVCPDSGSFTAWKTARRLIVKLEIPEDARRSSATGRKCRADKAKVLAIESPYGTPSDVTEVRSNKNPEFIYRVGEIVEEPDFCNDRFNECAEGIHFFINRQEAVDYIPYT